MAPKTCNQISGCYRLFAQRVHCTSATNYWEDSCLPQYFYFTCTQPSSINSRKKSLISKKNNKKFHKNGKKRHIVDIIKKLLLFLSTISSFSMANCNLEPPLRTKISWETFAQIAWKFATCVFFTFTSFSRKFCQRWSLVFTTRIIPTRIIRVF